MQRHCVLEYLISHSITILSKRYCEQLLKATFTSHLLMLLSNGRVEAVSALVNGAPDSGRKQLPQTCEWNACAADGASGRGRALVRHRIEKYPAFQVFRLPCILRVRQAGTRKTTHGCSSNLARPSCCSSSKNRSEGDYTGTHSAKRNRPRGGPVKSADFGRANSSTPRSDLGSATAHALPLEISGAAISLRLEPLCSKRSTETETCSGSTPYLPLKFTITGGN